jgi:hypothetical protein
MEASELHCWLVTFLGKSTSIQVHPLVLLWWANLTTKNSQYRFEPWSERRLALETNSVRGVM